MKKLKLSMFQIDRVEIGMAMIVIGFTTFARPAGLFV